MTPRQAPERIVFVIRALDERDVPHAVVWCGSPYMPSSHTMCGQRILPPRLHGAVDFDPRDRSACIGCAVAFRREVAP